MPNRSTEDIEAAARWQRWRREHLEPEVCPGGFKRGEEVYVTGGVMQGEYGYVVQWDVERWGFRRPHLVPVKLPRFESTQFWWMHPCQLNRLWEANAWVHHEWMEVSPEFAGEKPQWKYLPALPDTIRYGTYVPLPYVVKVELSKAGKARCERVGKEYQDDTSYRLP